MLWGERYAARIDDVQGLRAAIVGGICAALDLQIPLAEARRAQGRPAENLDAWQAFHLGLRQVHLYTRAGNDAAEALLPPGGRTGARASPAPMPALSFVHFQNAFLHYRPDRRGRDRAAPGAARSGRSALDPLDPFANFNMGRSHWLRQEIDAAMPWLERATAISPSYAQGVYSRALMDTLAGRSAAGFRARRPRHRPQPARPAALRHAGDEGARPHSSRARTPRRRGSPRPPPARPARTSSSR